jgi:hypothetical protein
VRTLGSPILAFSVLLGSCTDSASVVNQRESWREKAPRAYEFEFSFNCFCPGAGAWWRVIVENDVVASATPINPMVVPRGGFRPPAMGFPTIDSVFVQIERARAAGSASVEVSFDKDFHYPSSVAIDRERDTIDDEWSMQIRNFRVRRGSG